MKRLKQIVNQLKLTQATPDAALMREFIFYSPKMPLRLHQEQLIAASKQFSLPVFDTYFTNSNVTINYFSWGNGKRKVLLTHGWASKALDFYELIIELQKIEDLEIIAFDAPGNGSSISEFSNLMLYADSVKSIVLNYAQPDVLIGHSLGGMANVIALQALGLNPHLLISIAPLIRLKENFEQSLDSVNIGVKDQDVFFSNFAREFPVPADHFNLTELYQLSPDLDHFLAYDPADHISPYPFLKEFLDKYPTISSKPFEEVGHYKILRSVDVIEDIVKRISSLPVP
ncbi:Pimeloyl-ACP methyl ester carboxylesterase [Pedobacter terrae]|uniref:Pimeloyl-ACP methyl ester carboxylesterase n=1 Tax=Pedobacter terrae TaxID=405671 RepID=A0A1G7TT91_9SPHI|nr:alpha/beta hydrolase [Pedobacter terrae]SDG37909.1 Pimeloyl-ACP methyl ester carboxylesterase [Pedobacter terrae]